MEKRKSSAPPVYRPQPAASQPKQAAPPVYRPQPVASQLKPAPPVYRPQQVASQLKSSAPPAYRPQQVVSQPKLAPPVYRPQPAASLSHTTSQPNARASRAVSVRQVPMSPAANLPTARHRGPTVQQRMARAVQPKSHSRGTVQQQLSTIQRMIAHYCPNCDTMLAYQPSQGQPCTTCQYPNISCPHCSEVLGYTPGPGSSCYVCGYPDSQQVVGTNGTGTPQADPRDQWPTSGGMEEGEGSQIAAQLGWTQVNSTKFTCDEPSHTPKGKVYTNGDVFYGADNTGHVGWGFKVWTTKKGNMLHYAGNIVWKGTALGWVYKARGTKEKK
jgi:hypothetical protein